MGNCSCTSLQQDHEQDVEERERESESEIIASNKPNMAEKPKRKRMRPAASSSKKHFQPQPSRIRTIEEEHLVASTPKEMNLNPNLSGKRSKPKRRSVAASDATAPELSTGSEPDIDFFRGRNHGYQTTTSSDSKDDLISAHSDAGEELQHTISMDSDVNRIARTSTDLLDTVLGGITRNYTLTDDTFTTRRTSHSEFDRLGIDYKAQPIGNDNDNHPHRRQQSFGEFQAVPKQCRLAAPTDSQSISHTNTLSTAGSSSGGTVVSVPSLTESSDRSRKSVVRPLDDARISIMSTGALATVADLQIEPSDDESSSSTLSIHKKYEMPPRSQRSTQTKDRERLAKSLERSNSRKNLIASNPNLDFEDKDAFVILRPDSIN